MKKLIKALKFGGDIVYLISIYDIRMDSKGPKVQRTVFKTCKQYLTHIQNSVFEGELSISQYEELKYKLGLILRDDRDSCITFKGRNKKWMTKEFLTLEIDQDSNFI